MKASKSRDGLKEPGGCRTPGHYMPIFALVVDFWFEVWQDREIQPHQDAARHNEHAAVHCIVRTRLFLAGRKDGVARGR